MSLGLSLLLGNILAGNPELLTSKRVPTIARAHWFLHAPYLLYQRETRDIHRPFPNHDAHLLDFTYLLSTLGTINVSLLWRVFRSYEPGYVSLRGHITHLPKVLFTRRCYILSSCSFFILGIVSWARFDNK